MVFLKKVLKKASEVDKYNYNFVYQAILDPLF